MKEKLINICNPKQWKTLSTSELIENGLYDVYGANGIIGKYNVYNHEESVVTITCRGATCGNVHITSPKSYVNGNAMCLDNLNENICLKKYLYYYLQNYNMKKVISGSAQPQITVRGLSKIEIKLYDIDTQKVIINRLEKLEGLIGIRKKQIKYLDNLIKSQFVEMFGDPYFNRYNWKIGTIRELVSDVRYGTSKPSTEGGKYKYLRMNNITYNGKLDVTDIKYIDIPDNEIEKCSTKKGDILFNRTNSRELVGKTCVFDLDEKMVIAGFVIRVRVNELSNPYFLSEYLNTKYMKKNLYNMCKNASGQSNINAQELQNIKIYIPPIELQNQFADIVKQINKQKVKIQKSLEEMQQLQKSLMSNYF